jgi:hypothetical protein
MNEDKQVYDIISSGFDIGISEEITLDTIKIALTERIRYLLDHNMEHLVSLIYRIDLNQQKVDGIFSTGSKEDIAAELSEAIIERQLLKVRTRNFYKNKPGSIE